MIIRYFFIIQNLLFKKLKESKRTLQNVKNVYQFVNVTHLLRRNENMKILYTLGQVGNDIYFNGV